jgi:MinD superfamily P-loop ATPase
MSDAFTEKYSSRVTEGLRVMAGGPHTNDVMFGQSCSHVLTTPLKAYLPLLKLEDGEAVVIDEKAGSDGAGTGIVTGMTLAIIVAEPTPQSVKAARQIAELLSFFEVPYEFLVNKEKNSAPLGLEKEPIARIPFSDDMDVAGAKVYEAIAHEARKLEAKNPEARFERSRRKFEKNREYGQY